MGTKLDLEDERRVPKEEAQALAKQHKIDYFETSAKLNLNVDELMEYMMEKVCARIYPLD